MKKQKNVVSFEKQDYSKLTKDQLEILVDGRGIECKYKISEMIRLLELDDIDKYVRETTQEKEDNGYLIGIDIKNGKHLSEMGSRVEKKTARSLNRYCLGRVYYMTDEKFI